jgi:hypothetical protein
MTIDSRKQDQAYNRGREQAEFLLKTSMVQFWGDNANVVGKLIGWPKETVIEKVRAFHRERLDAVPDLTVYPELRGYRDLIDIEENAMREAGVDDNLIALSKSFNFWRDVRLQQETGKVYYAMALPEKCRVLYLPDSDRGPLHLKNTDDPLTYWTPQPPVERGTPWPQQHPISSDGVGSGLHIDEVPPEIFPVNVHGLWREECTTLREATELLVRYNYFWGHQNILLHDRHGDSVAIEKTRCRIATRGPNKQGINFINGMGALDPELSAFIKEQRQTYLDQRGEVWEESPEGCFFNTCENKWKNMARYVDELSLQPSYDNAKQLMEQRDKSGPMCLTGEKSHPDLPVGGCTLIMDIWIPRDKQRHRRQWRGQVPAFLDTPELIQYA